MYQQKTNDMKKSDLNLAVIENFILHLTHCSDEKEEAFKVPQTYTPEELYRVAYDYIQEDHVDGKGNPEDGVEQVSQELRYSIKDVLINMAIDCSLPEDMTCLDIDSVVELAQSKISGGDKYKELVTRNKLGGFVSMDLDEALEIWNKLTSENDNDMADDHFTMWEPLQYSLTIKQLAEQI